MWKPLPGFIAREDAATAFEKELKWAYGLAEKRAGWTCEVTGARLVRQSDDHYRVLTHHHLVPRSLDKRRRTDPSNILIVSLAVHKVITSGALWLLTAKHEKATTTRNYHHASWNRARVPKGTEPFTVKPNLLREAPQSL
jgi:hypothetical protein